MCGDGRGHEQGLAGCVRLHARVRARARASQATLSRKLVLQLRWRSVARTPCSCRILARYCSFLRVFVRFCTLLRPVGTTLHSRHAEASSGNGVRGCVSERASARARRRRERIQARGPQHCPAPPTRTFPRISPEASISPKQALPAPASEYRPNPSSSDV